MPAPIPVISDIKTNSKPTKTLKIATLFGEAISNKMAFAIIIKIDEEIVIKKPELPFNKIFLSKAKFMKILPILRFNFFLQVHLNIFLKFFLFYINLQIYQYLNLARKPYIYFHLLNTQNLQSKQFFAHH